MLPENIGIILGHFAQYFGITEPALRLLLSIFAGYPLAIIYRRFIYNELEHKQCIYFTLCGLILGFWNFGFGMFYCILSIFISYIAIYLLAAKKPLRKLMMTFVFLFNLIYLLLGYYYSSTDSYDIMWTMPQCILALRLIGVAFDVYDGDKPTKELSSDAVKTVLKKPPNLLQLFGHCLFPSAFLVGPQFSMRRFLNFVNKKYHVKFPNGEILPPNSTKYALKRFLLGLAYVIFFQILSLFVHDDLIISDKFAAMNFFKRMFLLGVWGRFILYKYISCWLLAEGACILFGISYNGEENGVQKWNGVENIKLFVFENSTEFNHYIISFNVNTNQWVAQHVYKRLKFLGNRYYSQGAVLLFLAIWHGIHTGYYLTFLHEFIVIYMERDFQLLVKSNKKLEEFFGNPLVKILSQILLRIYTFVFMGWALLPFAYLQFPRYWQSFSNCNYAGFILIYLWPVLYSPILRKVLGEKKQRKIL